MPGYDDGVVKEALVVFHRSGVVEGEMTQPGRVAWYDRLRKSDDGDFLFSCFPNPLTDKLSGLCLV